MPLAAVVAFLATVGPARAEDPGYTLERVLAAIAGAEVCGFELYPEQRRELAAAALRLQVEAHMTNADIDRLVIRISNTLGRDVCERGREGSASETARLIEELRRQP